MDAPIIEAKRSPGTAHAAADGVRHLVVGADSAGQRLDNFLAKVLKGVPRPHLYRVIRSGEVRINKGRAGADTKLAEGDSVRVPPMRTAERTDMPVAPPREFPVVFEDDVLLVIDKPAGVAVHGGSGESFGVIEQLRRARPKAEFLELVHRLDKDTSGLLMLAKRRSALVALQNDLRSKDAARTPRKTYAALVIGEWPPSLKVIDVALHKFVDGEGARQVRPVAADSGLGQRAISLVAVRQRTAACTLLEVTIKTGRTHQIRVHLKQAGHPIVGNAKYGDFEFNRALARGVSVPGLRFARMFLHAQTLRVKHPSTGEALALEAPLPAECRHLLVALGAPAG